MEEIGLYQELEGIEIMTDARHGWRKNAKDTSDVAIEEKSHKVPKYYTSEWCSVLTTWNEGTLTIIFIPKMHMLEIWLSTKL